MLMTILGALAFAGTALGAGGLLLIGATGSSNGGSAMAAVLLAVPFAGCLLLASGVAVARGGFEWVAPSSRNLQWLAVLAAALAAALVTAGSAALRREVPDQMPWALWPVRGWAFAVWPPLLTATMALALWPALRGGLPALAWKAPATLVGVVSLVVCAGLLVQAVQDAMAQSAAATARLAADNDRRDASVLADVEKADPVRDLVSLMNQTTRYEVPRIRTLALAKVRAHPDLNAALDQMLRGARRDDALTFLESNDAPDNQALAAPAREAMLGMAAELREDVRQPQMLHVDHFAPEVRRILAVADKFAAFGVDYVGPVRSIREALDAPEVKTMPLNCRTTLDQWLAKHSTR